MINVSTETDIERLREVAQVLMSENDRLHRRLQALVEEFGKATGERVEDVCGPDALGGSGIAEG